MLTALLLSLVPQDLAALDAHLRNVHLERREAFLEAWEAADEPRRDLVRAQFQTRRKTADFLRHIAPDIFVIVSRENDAGMGRRRTVGRDFPANVDIGIIRHEIENFRWHIGPGRQNAPIFRRWRFRKIFSFFVIEHRAAIRATGQSVEQSAHALAALLLLVSSISASAAII